MALLKRLALLLDLTLLAACQAKPPPAGAAAPLALERTIPLKDVRGRIDHLALDAPHGRLFVAELGAGAVEAIDLARGVSLGRITGLKEPQGVVYLPDRDELAVASGGDGTVRFYRAADLAPLGVVRLGDDADNARVVPRTGQVVVGYGSGGLAVLDPVSLKVVAKLALPAHPESFQLQGDTVFVNAPDAHRIFVGDLSTGKVTTSWPAAHRWNFPMALDAASGALAVVYRLPSRLQLIDSRKGVAIADVATCGDADDLFFDARRRRLYVICGSGAVDVIGTGAWRSLARIATRLGARTGAFSPEMDRLFVAARAGPVGADAAILVFRPVP